MTLLSQSRQKYLVVRREILAGLTIFLAMSYILFAAPIVLTSACQSPEEPCMPPGAVLLGTCIVSAIGSVFVGIYAMTPTAVAPAVGILVLFRAYEAQQGATWQSGLLAGFFAAVALLVLSAWRRKDRGDSKVALRRRLLNDMPPSIRAAVLSGVGTLLAAFSYEIITTKGGLLEGLYADPDVLVHEKGLWNWAFLIAVSCIAFNDVLIKGIYRRRLAVSTKSVGSREPIYDLVPFLTVIVLSALFHFYSEAKIQLPPSTDLFVLNNKSFWDGFLAPLVSDSLAGVVLPLSFALVLVALMLTDIAGSPFDILNDETYQKQFAPNLTPLERDDRINRSLLADSVVNLLAPFAGTVPAVFYAENRAGQLQGGVSGVTACVTGGLFALVALSVICAVKLFNYDLGNLLSLVPPLAIAPILFYVGVRIVAASFMIVDVPEGGNGREVDVLDYLPASMTTIVVSVSLDMPLSLLAGLICYWLINRVHEEEFKPSLALFTVGLGIAVVLTRYLSG